MDRNWSKRTAVKTEAAGGNIKINLEEQDHRFAREKSSAVRGTLIINRKDDRAVININVRNLHAAKGPYKLFFLGRRDGTSVYRNMCEIIPGDDGNTEFQIEVDPENIDGEGTDLSCFYIFMIAAAGEPIRPVLKGDMIKEQELPRMASSRAAAPVTYNSYYSEYIKEKTGELVRDYMTFVDISPFGDAWLTDKWKRVTDILKFPVASAGAQKQIQRYGHFIFGMSDDRFYLAVPGRHTSEEWPDGGGSGFMMWQPIRTSQEYGYWCMVIDCKSGIITEIS